MGEYSRKTEELAETENPFPASPMDELPKLIDASLEWAFDETRTHPPLLLPWISSMEQSGLGNPSSLQRILHLHGQLAGTPENRAAMAEIISEMRRMERAFLTAASHIDPLTGLRTRRDMLHTIEQELARFRRSGTPFCIAIADIDHFKLINDTFGHAAGDRVLEAVADEINNDIRSFDDAFRMGGEEFLICLKDIHPEAGLKTLERLRNRIEKLPVFIAENEAPVRFTISIGMASTHDADSAMKLVATSDERLYMAKTMGRNRVVAGNHLKNMEIP